MNEDYHNFLDEYGLNESFVRKLSESSVDQIPMPEGFENIYVSESKINGLGLFSFADVKAGYLLCPARINGFRTPAGRYTNHSPTPNAIFTAMEGDNLSLLAIKNIAADEEITIDYRQAMEINGAGYEKKDQCFNFPALASSHGLDISGMTNRQKIDVIEWIILNKCENIVDQLVIRNYINGGVYAREMTAPAGIVITGKIHLHDHINILSKGEISVMTDTGMMRVKAPFVIESKAGIKRIGYTHSEVVWTSIHASNKTEIHDLENELFSDGDISWVDDLVKTNLQVLT